jgi:hypothetical protein
MSGATGWTATGSVLSPDDVTRLFQDAIEDFGLNRRPLPAVLDSDCARTGLHYQLKKGLPPASVTTVRDGKIRLYREHAKGWVNVNGRESGRRHLSSAAGEDLSGSEDLCRP